MKHQWRNAWGYIKSCYGKRIVKSHSILSLVSVNKSANIGFNRENLFYKHKTDMKGVCDTLCMAGHYAYTITSVQLVYSSVSGHNKNVSCRTQIGKCWMQVPMHCDTSE